MYNKSQLSFSRESSIKQEINVLIKINHPNIVTFVDCFTTAAQIYIVMELIEGINLFNYFKKLWNSFYPSKKSKNSSSSSIPDIVLKRFYNHHKKSLKKIIGQVKNNY